MHIWDKYEQNEELNTLICTWATKTYLSNTDLPHEFIFSYISTVLVLLVRMKQYMYLQTTSLG